MTQLVRPYFQQDGTLRAYFPIDTDDQNLYNSFTYQYERYGFLDMFDRIQTGRSEFDIFFYWGLLTENTSKTTTGERSRRRGILETEEGWFDS